MTIISTKWTGEEDHHHEERKDRCEDKKSLQKLVYLVLDKEANQEDKVFFDNHIKNCVICAHEYQLGLTLKEAIKTKLEIKAAPAGLIDNIRRGVKADE